MTRKMGLIGELVRMAAFRSLLKIWESPLRKLIRHSDPKFGFRTSKMRNNKNFSKTFFFIIHKNGQRVDREKT